MKQGEEGQHAGWSLQRPGTRAQGNSRLPQRRGTSRLPALILQGRVSIASKRTCSG